uniref:exodeoxyribonuclease III n=1 Tax=Amphilophus citrinellus TaxID=61819 RepID=A0A3Q0RVA3_AMPCI
GKKNPNKALNIEYRMKNIQKYYRRLLKAILSEILLLKKYFMEKIQIALLQEVHLVDKEHSKLKQDWVDQAFYSSFSSNRRGVAILVHRAVPFVPESYKQDSEGRYILIQGSLWDKFITLMNIYAPNPPPPSFWTKVAAEQEEYKSPIMVLGGDFNCCSDEKKDRSPLMIQRKLSTRASLTKMLSDISLTDVWRTLNPLARDFTFYSNSHKSYSRIDYFFVPPQIMGQVTACSIGLIHISDHAPVYLQLSMADTAADKPRWHFPSYLLNDKDFKEKMEAEIKQFFDINDTSETSPEFLWESAKAYLRGFTISYMVHHKKTLQMKQNKLEMELKQAEATYKSQPTKVNFVKVQTIRAALDSVMNENAARSLFYQKQRMYEYGNKPSKYLAHLLNQRQHNNIASIRDMEGSRHFD